MADGSVLCFSRRFDRSRLSLRHCATLRPLLFSGEKNQNITLSSHPATLPFTILVNIPMSPSCSSPSLIVDAPVFVRTYSLNAMDRQKPGALLRERCPEFAEQQFRQAKVVCGEVCGKPEAAAIKQACMDAEHVRNSCAEFGRCPSHQPGQVNADSAFDFSSVYISNSGRPLQTRSFFKSEKLNKIILLYFQNYFLSLPRFW